MNPANVRSLSMKGTHEVRELFSIYPMNSLVQLRALTLTYICSSDDPTFQFWNQLSALKHLRPLVVNFSSYRALDEPLEDQEFLIRSIFNHGFCPASELFKIHISTYVISRMITRQFMSVTETTNLRDVLINCLTLSDFIAVLPAMQHVRSLHIHHQLCADEESIDNPPRINKSLLPKCELLCSKLCGE